jgi:putative ABC transport system permease protein
LSPTRAFPLLLLLAGLRYVLRHRWQGVLALTGIALGVAVVLAVDLANRSARAAFELSAAQLQGKATHRLIAADGALPESLYVDLRRQPGHPPMAPVVTDWVRVAGQAGRYRLVGLDLFAEGPFRGRLAAVTRRRELIDDWLTRPDALALGDAAARQFGVAADDSLQIVYRDRSSALRILAIDPAVSAGGEDLLLVDIATAQSVLGLSGYLSYVDLILDEAAVHWLRKRLPDDVQLVTVAEAAAGVTRLSAAFELNLTAMSLLALLVGMFLIFNAMSFSIVQRRRLLGRLRAVGVTPRELFRLILAEALILGVLGTVAGLMLGVWLGQGLTRLVAATVSELYYQVSVAALHPEPLAFFKAGGLGLAATLVASLVPARQAAWTPPLATLSRAALERVTQHRMPWLAVFGLAALVGGLTVALAVPGGVVMGFCGLFLLVLGAALLTPPLLHGLHRLIAARSPAGIPGMGVRNLDRHLSRLGIAIAALMVALSAGVGVGVMVDSMRGAVASWLNDLLRADLYVAAAGFRDGEALPAAVVSGVASLPGVAAVSRYRQRTLRLPERQVTLIGAHLTLPSRRGFELLGGGDASVWEAFDRGGLLISEPLAYHLDLTRGDLLSLPTPAGPHDFTVAGVFRDYASEHGRIFLEEGVYRRYWSDPTVNTMALFATGGDAAGLRREVSETFAGRYGLVLTAARTIFAESLAVFDRTFRITRVLRALLLSVAFIGVLSALMALQLERSKEHAVLRALGLTRAQIAGLITGESLVIGLAAACIAIPTGLLMAWVLIESVQRRAFGWTMPFEVDARLLAQTVLIGLLAAAAAAIYPAWRSSRRDPAPLLRED